MKVYQTSDIRNVALVGNAKSGKTTLAESLLFESGTINRKGSIDDKNTVSDYREIELDRKNSVVLTSLCSEYNDKKINILDVPGFSDYVGELVTALNVVEAAIILVNAQSGIEVGTELAVRNAAKINTPIIFNINQLDHEKANYDETIRQLKEYFGEKVTSIQYPVNAGIGFDSLIDLVSMKMLKYPKGGGKPEILDIPAGESEKAEQFRLALVEAAASGSDELMEKYFEEGDLNPDEMKKGLKLGIASRSIFPVLCTSGKENVGAKGLLDFITSFIPAPNESHFFRKTTNGKELKYDSKEPTSLFIFKTAIEPHLGEMSFMKVMNGEVTEAQDLINTSNQGKERISQILSCNGKNRQKLEKAVAGDIVCTIKLKDVKTNQTLATTKNAEEVVEPIQFPAPIFTTAVRTLNTANDEKMGAILSDMHNSDQTILVEYSRELKQIILRGQGELHLNTLKWYFDHQHKIEIEFYAPKIPYRETITKSAEAMYRHKKQSGGAGQFGEVHMLIEPYYEGMPNQTKYPVRGTETHPLAWGGKLIFNNCIVGGAIDARFMPAILKGIMEKIEEGPLTGSYARDIVVNVFDGKMHPVDSNEMAFKLAGRNAFREAFKNAAPKILEPIYDVEVMVPGESMGGVMTDLQGRRSIVMGMDSEGMYQKIRAKVPLAEMNRYSTALSSLTSGRGTYTMSFAEYQQVPADVQTALLKAYEEQEKDEE